MPKKTHLLLLIVILLTGCRKEGSQKVGSSADSLDKFLRIAYDDHLPYAIRQKNNIKALAIVEQQPDGSKKREYYFRIANRFWNMEDTVNYKLITCKILKNVRKSKDSFALAKAYSYLSDTYKNDRDSSYYYTYLSQKMYIKLKDTVQIAGMILKKAWDQFDANDLSGCEKSTYKALTFLNPDRIKQSEKMMYCYVMLGILNDAFRQFDKSLTFYNKALELSKKTNKNDIEHPRELIMIDIGLLYQNQEKFKEAIPFFKKALENKDLFVHQPKLYHLGLINLIYSNLKVGIDNSLPAKLSKIDELPDSFKFKDTNVDIKYILSQYYAIKKDTARALIVAKEAYKMACADKMRRTTLLTLRQLASLNPGNDTKYLNEYIRIQDSLQLLDRKTADKFARIEFETDNLIQQQKQLKAENARKDRKLISVAAFFALALLLLIITYLLNQQRLKIRELKLIKQKHDANEEMYNLMHAQQQRLEEGKQQEKKRIARELHDGVMGKLTSIRLNLFIIGKKQDPETIQKALAHIDEIHEVEKEIRNIAYDLGTDTFNANVDFITIVRSIFLAMETHSGTLFTLEADDDIDWQAIDGHLKMQLYRILQEASQNIVKHASASRVTVSIRRKTALIVTITDDGIGFDKRSINKGFGLVNMKDRVNELGGKLKIQSAPGSGTILMITVPLEPE